MEILTDIARQLQQGDREQVAALTRQALAQNIPARQILEQGLLRGMAVIGEQFKAREIFLPEVLLAARAMHSGTDELKPYFLKDPPPSQGKVVLGTVQGDLHDIGKNLVGIMLRGAGFEVIDLGNDVAPERFVETAEQEKATVIGMSALLTTTMSGMRKVIDLLGEKRLRPRVKTIIGGAPVSAAFAADIGADAFGYDAANAVEKVRQLAAGA